MTATWFAWKSPTGGGWSKKAPFSTPGLCRYGGKNAAGTGTTAQPWKHRADTGRQGYITRYVAGNRDTTLSRTLWVSSLRKDTPPRKYRSLLITSTAGLIRSSQRLQDDAVRTGWLVACTRAAQVAVVGRQVDTTCKYTASVTVTAVGALQETRMRLIPSGLPTRGVVVL